MKNLWRRFAADSRRVATWSIAISVPAGLFVAWHAWPSPISAWIIFVCGANLGLGIVMWRPVMIPYVVLPPTPDDLEKMDRIVRDQLRATIDQAAREAGFAGTVEIELTEEPPPANRRH